MPQQPGRTKASQREATTRALITVAREMFAAHGYAQTAAEDIVARAGVTRGALYHHFDGKEGLFRAVLADIAGDVAARIDAATGGLDGLWPMLTVGCRVFLEASLDPAVQRIMLIDGPAVLGWQAWRDIDAGTSMRGLASLLEQLRQHGEIVPLPVEALTHLLSGAMNEAALWIAQVDDQQAALADAIVALDHLLHSLRA